MSSIIEIRDLNKNYGQLAAVKHLNLSIDQGELFGFIGPNGAGKTSTIRMLATLLQPSGGDAWVAGQSVRQHPRGVRRLIGYMPDFFGVYDDMKGWEYLDFFGACYEIPEAQRAGLIDDLLELVGLGPRRPGAPGQMPGLRPRPARGYRNPRAAARAQPDGQDDFLLHAHPGRRGRDLHAGRHRGGRAARGAGQPSGDAAPLDAPPPAANHAVRAARRSPAGFARARRRARSPRPGTQPQPPPSYAGGRLYGRRSGRQRAARISRQPPCGRPAFHRIHARCGRWRLTRYPS